MGSEKHYEVTANRALASVVLLFLILPQIVFFVGYSTVMIIVMIVQDVVAFSPYLLNLMPSALASAVIYSFELLWDHSDYD